MKIVLLAFTGIIALNLAACSTPDGEKAQSKAAQKAKLRVGEKPKFHEGMDTSAPKTPGSPVLQSLKENHLEVSSTVSIGEAFDAYKFAVKKEWRETPTPRGPYYIDYLCWIDISPVSAAALKEGVVKRMLEIKFAIHEDGVTYIALATLIDTKTDGMIHTTYIDPPGIKKIVSAIYENREITF